MLAGAVDDVEGKLSSKNLLQDKDLIAPDTLHVHDIFDNRPVTMLF